jgi:hypothetical protein
MTLKKLLTFIVLLSIACSVRAHVPVNSLLTVDTSSYNLYLYTDVYPSFPGGNNRLKEFVSKNLRWTSGEIDFIGTILTSFIVEKDGRITNVKIEKGGCELCNVESIRLVSNMPDWRPGRNAGKPVRTLLFLPLRFEIKE